MKREKALKTRRGFLRHSLLATSSLPLIGSKGFGKSAAVKKILADYYAAYEKLDIEKILSFYAEDCLFEDPTSQLFFQGKAALRKFAEGQIPFALEAKFTVSNLIAGKDWLVSEHVQSGRVKDPRSPDALPKSYSVRGVSIFEFANGKIKRQTDFYDVLTLRKQLSQKA